MPQSTLIEVVRKSSTGLSHMRYAAGYSYEDFRQAITDALTPQEIVWAREWLMDCQWNDVDGTDIEEFDNFTIVKGVARNYDGGVVAFIAACY